MEESGFMLLFDFLLSSKKFSLFQMFPIAIKNSHKLNDITRFASYPSSKMLQHNSIRLFFLYRINLQNWQGIYIS